MKVLFCAFVFFYICTGQKTFQLPVQKHKTINAAFTGLAGIPILGSVSKFGEYFIQFTIGNPPQTLFAQIDTGSTDLLLYGSACVGCPAGATTFNKGASKTDQLVACTSKQFQCDPAACFNVTTCGFNDGYGDGSDVSGMVLQDIFNVGGLTVGNVSFGSIQKSTPGFEPTGVDGIFGLAWPSTSSWAADSAITVLMKKQGMYKAFGMCLKADGGTLTLGLNAHSDTAFQFAPSPSQQLYYTIQLTDMKIGGTSLGISATTLNGQFGALVDSGTTLMIIPDDAFNALKLKMTALCATVTLPGVCNPPAGQSLFDGYCYQMTPADIAKFPDFAVSAKGLTTDLAVPASIYLIPQQQYMCLGITTAGAGEAICILGDTFMSAYNVVFDQETNSVGFGPSSSCP